MTDALLLQFKKRRQVERSLFSVLLGVSMFLFVLTIVSDKNLEAAEIELSDQEAHQIGMRIWKNECGGTVSGLTSWNKGEHFASLGIGHFIWYPRGTSGPFEESFPKFLEYLQQNGVRMPKWLARADGCPWPNRETFLRDSNSQCMMQLRLLLKHTIPMQARFAALRLEQSLPKMLASAPPAERDTIEQNFYRVAQKPTGLYALMDYVNFKGEGTSLTERYNGHGWGLLQVLAGMGKGPPLKEFAASADRVLTLRVENAPPERDEQQWLPGWRNRVKTYVP